MASGKHESYGCQNKKKIILVACGSFNPITNMHLRMFEIARDALEQIQPCMVIGVISPVNDKYAQKELTAASDRIEMIALATASSDWIKLDTWEARQDHWCESVKVLRHVREASATYFSVTDENDNIGGRLPKRRKTDEAHDANENVGKFEDGANMPLTDVEVRLLCGADVIQSFAVPNLWKPIHLEEIARDFGIVVCNRVGYDLDKFIYEVDVLNTYKNNITVVTDWITNEISSTKIRRALKRGESIKYLLPDSVIDYIYHKQLYNTKLTK